MRRLLLVHLKSRRFRRNPISSRWMYAPVVKERCPATRAVDSLILVSSGSCCDKSTKSSSAMYPRLRWFRALISMSPKPSVVPVGTTGSKRKILSSPTSSSVVSVSDEGAALRSPTPAVALKSEKMHRATHSQKAEGHFSVPDVLKPAFGEVCMGRAVGWRGSGPV